MTEDDHKQATKILVQMIEVLDAEVKANRLSTEEAWRIRQAIKQVVLGEEER